MEKKQLEKNISAALGKFYKELLGKGPKVVKTKIIEDMLVVRFEPYPEPILCHLSNSEQGIKIIRKIKCTVFESVKEDVIELIHQLLQPYKVRQIYYDGKVEDEESILIITMKEKIESRLEDEAGA